MTTLKSLVVVAKTNSAVVVPSLASYANLVNWGYYNVHTAINPIDSRQILTRSGDHNTYSILLCANIFWVVSTNVSPPRSPLPWSISAKY